MPLLCCDVGLVSELRLTAGCVLMDLASLVVSWTSVYANGLMKQKIVHTNADVQSVQFRKFLLSRILIENSGLEICYWHGEYGNVSLLTG